MKKIFVLTGEPSGDKLASKVIAQLKNSKTDIEYLSVGGEHLKALGIQSLYDLKEVTYLGFTRVLLNIFKIKKKINETVDKIIEFNPDILFSVDSPDFTLRVAERVKKLKSNIKTIHYVAPQIWVWREHRVKKLKIFLDHILLLFPFEKKYFEKENIGLIRITIDKLEKCLTIVQFLMSCRALGKGIEEELICWLLRQGQDQGLETIKALFVSSERNQPVEILYRKGGLLKGKKQIPIQGNI